VRPFAFEARDAFTLEKEQENGADLSELTDE
jgi:hypothetical protein